MQDFINRVAPALWENIELKKELSAEESYFELDSKQNKILITATDDSALTRGIGYYLEKYTDFDFTLCGGEKKAPTCYPLPKKERKKILQQYRVYLNYCTFSYSAAFWDWDRWQQEIDRMALKGINMPLALVGTEAVWFSVLTKCGLSKKEALDSISTSPFFAWQLMGNVQGLMPPRSEQYLQKRLELGKKIIEREKELGMTPILHGFSGSVPASLIAKLKSGEYARAWCKFPKTGLLDPVSRPFAEIGKLYLKEQKRLLGESRYFAADPFHENAPPKKGNKYLAQVAHAICGIMEEVCPDYVWVMQSWSLREGIIQAIPDERLLILDIDGKKYIKHNFFSGKKFVLGTLHNYGARNMMHGDVKAVAENEFMQLKEVAPNLAGVGLFMEGIGHNPLFCELFFDMMCEENAINLDRWLAQYAKRRYKSESMKRELKALVDTVYKRGTTFDDPSSIFCARASMQLKTSGAYTGSFIFKYRPQELYKILTDYCAHESTSGGYFFDIMDIARQMLSAFAYDLYLEYQKAYRKKDIEKVKSVSLQFLECMKDVEILLRTREEYNFYAYSANAKRMATSREEENDFCLAAKLQCTLWYDIPEPILYDYAFHEWAGLMDYYQKRWEAFFEYALDCLMKKKRIKKIKDGMGGHPPRTAGSLGKVLKNAEDEWIYGALAERPVFGDTKAVVNMLLKKYSMLEEKDYD